MLNEVDDWPRNRSSQPPPTSIVYQFVQTCPYRCGICNRRSRHGERRLTAEERLRLVDRLAALGVGRITVTGGEPMVQAEAVLELLGAAHDRRIHTALSTTGHEIDGRLLRRLDRVLDHLLLSVRSLDPDEWRKDYGHAPQADRLLETVLRLLLQVRETGIIVEVSTVVHQQNIDRVIDLGHRLAALNPDIIWRIEDYYAMGIFADDSGLYEVQPSESDRLREVLDFEFGHVFRQIYFSRRDRDSAPDYMITPAGDCVTTSGNRYGCAVGNLLDPRFEPALSNRRPWSDYQKYCRNWSNTVRREAAIQVYPSANKVPWEDELAGDIRHVQIVALYWPDWIKRLDQRFGEILAARGKIDLITPDPDDSAACEQALLRFPKNGDWPAVANKIGLTYEALRDAAYDRDLERLTWIRLAQAPSFPAVRIDDQLFVSHFDIRYTPYNSPTPMTRYDLGKTPVWRDYWARQEARWADSRINLSFFPEMMLPQSRDLLRLFHHRLGIDWKSELRIGTQQWHDLREWCRFATLTERALADEGVARARLGFDLRIAVVAHGATHWSWTWSSAPELSVHYHGPGDWRVGHQPDLDSAARCARYVARKLKLGARAMTT